MCDLGPQAGDRLRGGGAAGDEAGEGFVAVDEGVNPFMAARVQSDEIVVMFVGCPAVAGFNDAPVVKVVQLESTIRTDTTAKSAADFTMLELLLGKPAGTAGKPGQ
ncbi:hypothetical protein ASC63_06985 [Leifsonia sp. Root112D2]|nr:hypothetical protein ASC63_06985 [Leifsonia sp. Root112D2]